MKIKIRKDLFNRLKTNNQDVIDEYNRIKSKTKEDTRPDCQNHNTCGNKARYNIQNPMIVWKLDRNGDTGSKPVEYGYHNDDGDENYYLCEDCK